mmetsp:Transcript_4807/g.642  ORF Transcript_4807/g.642 Transcript_4807/m.642 type:complete len:105 (+) Transcript_4807:3-317(+)
MVHMHNVTARLNATFFYGLSLMGIFAGISAVTGVLSERTATAEINNIQVQYVYNNTRFKWDESDIKFDLEADLSNSFDWNVKLLFIWVEVEYSENFVIIWDKII